MVIPEIARPDDYPEERNSVDLIWFPTGGGKTEAYFGVFAFTTFLKTKRSCRRMWGCINHAVYP